MTDDKQEALDLIVGTPLRIAIIIVGAVLLAVVLRWVVRRLVTRLSKISGGSHISRAQVALGGQPKRLGQRLRTFQSVINSTITALIGTVALLTILSEFNLDVRPLLASAGIAGVAIAFGAQSLVQDIVTGLFMIAEDQYGVGDRVELAGPYGALASGTVERVALRVTTIRDDSGELWHLRNGEIIRVANETQGWVLATAEVRLDPESDLARAQEVLLETTTAMVADEGWEQTVLAKPSVFVEDLAADYVLLHWSVRTTAGAQWNVASGFRRRLPKALSEAGLKLAK